MLFETQIREREALAVLLCATRNAARVMLQPAAMGYIEKPLALHDAYVELSGALERFDEAVEETTAAGQGWAKVLDAFTCKCAKPEPDGLQVCRCCGSFVPDESGEG